MDTPITHLVADRSALSGAARVDPVAAAARRARHARRRTTRWRSRSSARARRRRTALEVAERLAAELAARGVTIVSGLARGIDTAAHRGALAAGGRTLAVLGRGIGRRLPAGERRARRARSPSAGALLSQFPPGTPPLAHHFPARNRTLAGLALGVVVVEAAERSGALITAGLAGDLGREVFAVPGRITSPASRRREWPHPGRC